jgi:thermitase
VSHEDLAGKVTATSCANALCGSAVGDGQDVDGHGTAVSGIAAAKTNNGKGIASVAPDANLSVARVAPSGAGTSSVNGQDVEAAIKWAADQTLKVINVSLGDPNFPATKVTGSGLWQGVKYASDKGAVTVIASADPTSLGLVNQDFRDLKVIVVGSTDRKGNVIAMPSLPAKWAIVAPGGSAPAGSAAAGSASDSTNGVVSTWIQPDGYRSSFGASLAAPHVSAAMALLLAERFTPDEAAAKLVSTADRKGICGVNCGSLNVGVATGALNKPPPPPGQGGGGTSGSTLPSSVGSDNGDNSLPSGYTLGAAPTTAPLAGGINGAGNGNGGGSGRPSNNVAAGAQPVTKLRLRPSPNSNNRNHVAALIGLTVLAGLGVAYAVRGLARNRSRGKPTSNLA